jgi:hypothetical protein
VLSKQRDALKLQVAQLSAKCAGVLFDPVSLSARMSCR